MGSIDIHYKKGINMNNSDDILYYIVLRCYSSLERPEDTADERIILYGWSCSKAVIKAFISQRSKEKYRITKILKSVLEERFPNIDLCKDNKIDMVELYSSNNGNKYKILMTQKELDEVKGKIVSMFKDYSNLVSIHNGDTNILELFLNLKKPYTRALEYLGFDTSTAYTYDSDDSYDRYEEYDINRYSSSVFDKIIYSIESFIMVMKNDM